MSNDLINRKEVIKILDECGYVNCHDGKDFEANNRVDKCRQRVLDLPSAYDVDKVCRKINESKDMDNLIDADHAIKIVKSGECSEWLEVIADELESPAKPKWIPAEEPPKNDKYILLSFENFSVPQVGRYEEDEDGGAYYLGDEEKSCISQELIVNAWMPLPKAYRDDEEEIFEYGQSNEKAGSVSRNAKTAADIDQAIEYFKDEISQMDVFSDIVHFQEKERKSIEMRYGRCRKCRRLFRGSRMAAASVRHRTDKVVADGSRVRRSTWRKQGYVLSAAGKLQTGTGNIAVRRVQRKDILRSRSSAIKRGTRGLRRHKKSMPNGESWKIH